MDWSTHRNLDRAFRLHRARNDGRLLASLSLLLGLLAASTVVAADAWQILPDVWRRAMMSPAAVEWELPRAELSQADRDEPIAPGEHPAADGIPTGQDEETDTSSSPAESDVSTPASGPFADEARSSQPVRYLVPDDYIPSWRQAPVEGNRSPGPRRSQQVVLGPEGRVAGQLVSLSELGTAPQPLVNVRVFFMRSGELAGTSRTDNTGQFHIVGLLPGTYSVIAAGADTLMAYALHVRLPEDHEAQPADDIVPQAPVPLHSAVIRGEDVPLILARIARMSAAGGGPVKEVEPKLAEIPREVQSIVQAGVPGTPLVFHPVTLDTQGQLVGHVRQLHAETGRPLRPPATRVVIFQDAAVIATAVTDVHGTFLLTGLTPGNYSLVATTLETTADQIAGNSAIEPHQVAVLDDTPRSGFAAFAIQVQAAPAGPAESERLQPVGAEEDPRWPLTLDFALLDAADLLAFTQEEATGRRRRSSTDNLQASQRASADRQQTSVASPSPARTLVNSPGYGGGSVVPFVPPVRGGEPLVSPPFP